MKKAAAVTRYLLFAASVFLVLVTATWVGLSTAFAGFGVETAVLGLLVGLVGLAVLDRCSSAFVAGFRGDDS